MTAELSCRELVELVSAYLDGELDVVDRRRFDDHLADCDGCRTYLDQVRRTVALTRSLRADDIDPAMLGHLTAAFRDWRDQPPSSVR